MLPARFPVARSSASRASPPVDPGITCWSAPPGEIHLVRNVFPIASIVGST